MEARFSDRTLSDEEKPMNKSDIKKSVRGENTKINAAVEALIEYGNLVYAGKKLIFATAYRAPF
jgi:hypothetical protein